MNLLKPTNTLQRLGTFQKDFDLLETFIDDFMKFHGKTMFKNIPSSDFSPSLDVIEQEKNFKINIEISGIQKENIEININDGILIISGAKKEEEEDIKKENYIIISERSYGSFRREIAIPEHVDTEKITASHKDGVLSIFLPKKEIKPEKQIKKINIES